MGNSMLIFIPFKTFYPLDNVVWLLNLKLHFLVLTRSSYVALGGLELPM